MKVYRAVVKIRHGALNNVAWGKNCTDNIFAITAQSV